MATVEIARLADEDLRALIETRSLPSDTRERVGRSLKTLEQFPRAGKALVSGIWRGYRALIGPWGWLIAAYVYEEVRVITRIDALWVDGGMAGARSSPHSITVRP